MNIQRIGGGNYSFAPENPNSRTEQLAKAMKSELSCTIHELSSLKPDDSHQIRLLAERIVNLVKTAKEAEVC